MVSLAALILAWSVQSAGAQVPPSSAEVSAYSGLHRAAHAGDLAAIATLVKGNADLGARDGNGRTALHVAAFASHEAAVAVLAKAGADVNALDGDKYDMVTIAAVANDLDMLKAALAAGNRADLTTSIYDGTALIAAAHLGHADVVKILIDAGAPLDHVNNLGWTALIEAVVLGDGRKLISRRSGIWSMPGQIARSRTARARGRSTSPNNADIRKLSPCWRNNRRLRAASSQIPKQLASPDRLHGR